MRTRTLATALLLAVTLPAAARATPARGMVRIPAGRYRPLYAVAGERSVRVAAFALDVAPVTRADFLRFVIANPQWRRGSVRPLFADAGYLADWPAAVDAGQGGALRRPVTGVSWFAARAYCAAEGKRLPTVDEWEYAAAARRHGVRGLPGDVWEWTDDFDSMVVGDDSRASGGGQDARDHHLFCASAAIGATDPSDYPAFARAAVRAALTARSTVRVVGFRCASSVPT